MILWEKPGVELITRYRVDFVRDPKKWSILNFGCFIEPDDYYEKRYFTDVGEAYSFYVLMIFDNTCFTVSMFEEIIMNGETVREADIDTCTDFDDTMKRLINSEAQAEIKQLKNRIRDLEIYREEDR